MITDMTSRKYTLKRRAEKQAQTRSRIVEAAMALHEEVGPRETTISAVAERAGVQRLTVYRHFPGDAELFAACTSTWLERNPPPDLLEGRDEAPAARVRRALEALYGYYRRTARMWTAAHRDVDRVPSLAEPMEQFAGHLDRNAKVLLTALAPPRHRRKRVAATLGHALEFATWKSLADRGLGDKAIAALVSDWIAATANA